MFRLHSILLVTLMIGIGIDTAHAHEVKTSFYRFDIAPIARNSIADFSSLNAPLTTPDRLGVCGPALCKAGSTVPVRLFGVNLGFSAALPDTAQAVQLAQRLRTLGVNFVRLHALDSASTSTGENATGLLTSATFPTLDPDAVDRLRTLIEQLRANGIYVDLNLHVMYGFRPAIDKITSLNSDQALPNQSKPFLIFEDTLIRLQTRYASRLLEALRGPGNPALALIEINNESSLVYAWMNGDLNHVVAGPYRSLLVEKWQRFASDHGFRVADANLGLPVLRKDDESRISRGFLEFLVEQDKQYVDAMAHAIHLADPQILVIGTQMSFGGLPNFRSMSNMDVLDNHFYIDHYVFPRRMWQWDDWQIADSSNIGTGLKPLLGSAFYRDFSKPFLITEFNQPWPNRQGTEILPEAVAFASQQDWSGLALYDYSHSRDLLVTSLPREFSLTGDAAKLVQFGQAAWTFRTGAIPSLGAVMAYSVDDRVAFDAVSERVTNGLATFLDNHSIAAGSSPLTARTGYAAGQTGSHPITAVTPASPTVHVDFAAHQMVVDAPMVKGITGYLTTGHTYDYGSFKVRLGEQARGFVAVTLSSRDSQPVSLSRDLLLTLPGYTTSSQGSGTSATPLELRLANQSIEQTLASTLTRTPAPWNLFDPSTRHVIGLRDTRAPIWMERIPCAVAFDSKAASLRVYPLDSSGRRMPALDESFIRKTPDGFEVNLQSNAQTLAPWYELQADF